ncbi:MAG TPA: hypothetical protein VNT51_03975, partial [Miltoncostaeaceae bacterium]|nr:hypothetical protein [Miltoncostaeaceae bacterium]
IYPSPREGALPFTAAVLGTLVALLALPITLLAGGPAEGWLLGLGLWVGNWTAQLYAARAASRAQDRGQGPAAVGISGVSLIARAWLVAIVLFLVALRVSEPIALTAAVVFLAAFTFDFTGRLLLHGMQSGASRPSAGTTTDS